MTTNVMKEMVKLNGLLDGKLVLSYVCEEMKHFSFTKQFKRYSKDVDIYIKSDTLRVNTCKVNHDAYGDVTSFKKGHSETFEIKNFVCHEIIGWLEDTGFIKL